MFMKALYHWHMYAGTITDQETVVNDFTAHIANHKPVNVTENSTRVFVWFGDPDNLIMYTLPLEYKKYITGGIKA